MYSVSSVRFAAGSGWSVGTTENSLLLEYEE
jgi:hypothetical protein